MKKTNCIFLTLALVLVWGVGVLKAQDRFFLQKSKITFESETPVETIKAVNASSQGVVITGKNKFLIRVPIQAFKFKRRLQQTHFNENYMESNKYPNAVFRGQLDGNYDLTKEGTYQVKAKGKLDIHGVKKDRTVPATIIVKNGLANFKAQFIVKPADHGIKIPKVVAGKIANEIKVNIQSELKKK
ncbi:YceI family protein [uncultured Microscilla sp.]|uniref:YceI family protein n=1 Tax=uncultured Microscilla sp. TaxID=432653 RepID=UPI0026149247|nr:YceI family protein [uncultured Microscilla sp.]